MTVRVQSVDQHADLPVPKVNQVTQLCLGGCVVVDANKIRGLELRRIDDDEWNLPINHVRDYWVIVRQRRDDESVHEAAYGQRFVFLRTRLRQRPAMAQREE